jgi:hypothetical protein
MCMAEVVEAYASDTAPLQIRRKPAVTLSGWRDVRLSAERLKT